MHCSNSFEEWVTPGTLLFYNAGGYEISAGEKSSRTYSNIVSFGRRIQIYQ
jgi:hypothetical protein